jgi:hypothetical protein
MSQRSLAVHSTPLLPESTAAQWADLPCQSNTTILWSLIRLPHPQPPAPVHTPHLVMVADHHHPLPPRRCRRQQALQQRHLAAPRHQPRHHGCTRPAAAAAARSTSSLGPRALSVTSTSRSPCRCAAGVVGGVCWRLGLKLWQQVSVDGQALQVVDQETQQGVARPRMPAAGVQWGEGERKHSMAG